MRSDAELLPPVERITITRARIDRPLTDGVWLYTVTTAGNYTASGTLEECRTIARKRRLDTGLDISEDWRLTSREWTANKRIRAKAAPPMRREEFAAGHQRYLEEGTGVDRENEED